MTPTLRPAETTIFIVDDDVAARDSLALLLSLKGYRTLAFSQAETFLSTFRAEWKGCVLVDVRMPGMDGLTLQREMRLRHINLPVIIMTAHGDVTTARHALRAGAVDFLEKPLDDNALISAINEALARETSSEENLQTGNLNRLTRREREVMDLLVEGLPNRDVAVRLEISARTVEVYKARLMEKLNVKNLAELIRVAQHSPYKTEK